MQKELDETSADFEEYARFCDDQSVEKDYAITKVQKEPDETTAVSEEYEKTNKLIGEQIKERDELRNDVLPSGARLQRLLRRDPGT